MPMTLKPRDAPYTYELHLLPYYSCFSKRHCEGLLIITSANTRCLSANGISVKSSMKSALCTGCSAHPYALFTPLFWSVHLQSKSPHIMYWYGKALGWRFFSFIAEDSRAKVTEPAVTNPPVSSHTARPALRGQRGL